MSRKQTDSESSGEAPRNPASEVYGGAVAEIIAATPRESDWAPAEPMELRIVRRRQPQSIDELDPEEREQLAAMFHHEPLETILAPGYTLDDMPLEIKAQRGMSLRPRRERRRTVADDLYRKLVEEKQSFWTAVYPLYMEREITKQNVRDIVRRGLEEARGNYKIVCRMFNMEQNDYKRFLNFLRKHDCQLPFKEFR